MKRKLFIVLATMLIITGAVNAQQQPTHYPFNYHDFPSTMTAIIQVQIDGVEQTSSDYELGAFNGETVTGAKRIGVYGSAGYHRVYLTVYGQSTYLVTFKLYNHQTGVELDNCIITYQGEPYTFTWVSDSGIGSNKKPIVLNFITAPTFTKTISAHTTNGGWHLIASPLADGTSPENVGEMLNNSYDLYRFNQSAPANDQGITLEWENWKNQSEEHYHFNLEPGKGYLYANSANVTLSFTGMAYTGNGQVTLVKDDNAELAGWNLVGNPFAQTAYISKPFYTTNPDGTEIIAGTGNSIAAMEGIFVIADTDGETMTFSTEQRDVQNQQFGINVNRNRGNIIDRAIVRFSEETTLPKFMLNRNSTKLYIPQNGQDYAIVHSEGIGELPLNFVVSENGTYSISADVEAVEMNYLHLIDNKTGTDVDLLQTSSYTFEANTTDYASRFKIVFATENASIETATDSFAYFNNGKLMVANEGQASLQVVDMMGRILKSEAINGSAEINMNELAGVYVLRLTNGNGQKVQKIVIR